MNSTKLNDWIQSLSGLVIVIGLGLVIWELRQNHETTASQLSSDHYQIAVQHYSALFGENPAEVLAKACDSPEMLTRAELLVLENYYKDVVGKIERTFILSKRGRFYSDEFWQITISWLDSLFWTEPGLAYWHINKSYLDPEVLAAAEKYFSDWKGQACSEYLDNWTEIIRNSTQAASR